MEDDEALARALQDLEYRNQTARMNNNTPNNNSATPNNYRPGTSARRVMNYRNNATQSQAPPPQAQARLFPVTNSAGTPVVTGTAIPTTNNTNTAAAATTTVPGRRLRQPPSSSSSSKRNNPPQDPPAPTTSRSKASAGSSRKSNNSKKSSRSMKSNKSSKTTRSSAKSNNNNSNSTMVTPTQAPTMSSSAATSRPTTYDLLSAPNDSTATSARATTRRQQQQPEGQFVSLDNVFPSSQIGQEQQRQREPPRSKSKTPRKSKSSRSSSHLAASTAPREPSPSRTQQRGSSKTPNKANASTSSSTKRSKSTTKHKKTGSSGNTTTTSASSSSISRQQQQQHQQATVAALPPPNSYEQQHQQRPRSSRSTTQIGAAGAPTSRATSRSTSRSRPGGVPQQGSTSSTSRQLQPVTFATTSAPPPTNPAATSTSTTNTTPQRATVIPMTLPPPSSTPTRSAPTAVTMSDEEYARQLAQKFRDDNGIQPSPPKQASAAVIPALKLSESQEKKLTDEEYARKLAQEYRSDVGIPPSPTSVASLEDLGEDIEDFETAKKVAQELEDEELALRMTQADLDAAAVQRIARAEALRGTNQGYVQTEADIIAHQTAVANGELVIAPHQPQPWWRRLLRCLMPIGVFVAVGVGLWFAFGGKDGTGWPGLPTIGDNDPFDGVNPTETSQWEASKNKNGLTLEVLDGLDQEWEGLFHTAMSDWENGTPDALSLTRKDIGYDGNCDHADLKMKVCNDDYDDTGWRGINQVMINHKGWIVSSVAKVNDFYLKNADNDQRRYTMCHEIGHGFGLPHTDENFFNKDLGNCMDYTNKPHNNLTPDDSNFNLLADWYGEVTATRRISEGDESQESGISSEVPESAWVESMEAAKMLESGNIVDIMNDTPRHRPGRTLQWELVHQSAAGGEFRIELSSGCVMIAHALLAEPLV